MFRRSKKPDPQSRQSTRNVLPRNRQEVFSYHASRSARDTDDERLLESIQKRNEHHKSITRQRLKTTIVVLVLLAALTDISWLNTVPKVTIVGAVNERALLQPTSVYTQAATQLLSSSVANHNKITVNDRGITSKLEQLYPELASVSLESPLFGHQPLLYITPAPAALRYATAAGTAFILDANGKALAPVGDLSAAEAARIPLVTDQSGLLVKTGDAALPASDVSFIQEVIAQLQAKSFRITSLTLPRGTSELDVRLVGKPYYIKFNLEAAADPQIGTFLAVVKYLSTKQVTPSQYIDVRVPGRSYYI